MVEITKTLVLEGEYSSWAYKFRVLDNDIYVSMEAWIHSWASIDEKSKKITVYDFANLSLKVIDIDAQTIATLLINMATRPGDYGAELRDTSVLGRYAIAIVRTSPYPIHVIKRGSDIQTISPPANITFLYPCISPGGRYIVIPAYDSSDGNYYWYIYEGS